MRLNDENKRHLKDALGIIAEAQSRLRSIDFEHHSGEPLETENQRLRERIALMEREAAGEDINPKTGKGQNGNSSNTKTAVAAREFATRALGDERVSDVSNELLVHWVREALARMPFRLMLIAILYFGLDGSGPRTLAQVAQMLGRSRANVAQNRDKALRRCRFPESLRSLNELKNGVRG